MDYGDVSTLGGLNHLTAIEIAGLIRARDVSPVEVLQAHLDAITRLNPTVNAICTLATERAMTSARCTRFTFTPEAVSFQTPTTV